jgi:hypothetical protein
MAGWSFDESYWQEVIKKPDWYLEFIPYFQKAQASLSKDSSELSQFKKTIRTFFEEQFNTGKLALAKEGPDLDAQRQPIDTIVIHHTSSKPGYRLPFMNITQLLNIYAPYYMNPTVREERDLKGTAIWSSHFREGKPSFLAYHWLLRMQGTFERLLDDEQLGWHAGNWEINKSSVAICLDNDYENMCPTNDILKILATHIKQNYPQVRPDRIIGHCEARKGTTCPGKHFMSEWKPILIKYIRE